jgi:phage tail-like protein
MAETIRYPIPGFHFMVTFDGLPFGIAIIDSQFSEVSGLTAELATEELTEGGENRFVHKLPVRVKYPNLVLKRGLFPLSTPLIRWAKEAINNLDIKPCSVMVTLLNDLHVPVKIWNFSNAYPVKLQVSDFKATDNSLVIETIELAYDYFHELTP